MNSITIRPGLAATILLAVFAFIALPIRKSAAQQTPSAKTLTVEDIYAHGPIGGRPPQGLTWSPDGEHLTYLDGGELIDLDPGTAKSHVMVSRAKLSSLSSNSGSEKDRDHRLRYGMASYFWAPDSAHLLFDSNGSFWLYDVKTGTGLNVGSSGAGSGDDPKFSPDGRYVSFINDNGAERGLSVIRLREAGSPTNPVATSANPAVLSGKVDWVYEEELDVRSNYFWAPDSAHLAFLQMDESSVTQYPLTDWIPEHAAVEMQRYPQPGDPNPAVHVGIAGPTGGKVVWIKLPPGEFKPGDDYIPRFGWVDRKYVWIETLNRDHKHKSLYFADSSNGNSKLVLAQQDDKFFDAKYDVSIAGGAIVLSSWQDGHEHLYLYSYNGDDPLGGQAKLVRQLTKGDFDVDEVLRVDHAGKTILYTSNEGAAQDQQIWMVTFDGEKTAITTVPGAHEGTIPPRGNYYVDRFSDRTTPESVSLCRIGGACNLFWSTRAYEPYGLRTPEQLAVKASDGTTLYATILLPEGKTEPHSVPLIVNPYGGPGPMTVSNHFGGDGFLFDQLLAQHGFAVLHTDNRGTGRRGRDFAQFAYHNIGPIQFEDQLAVADAVLAKYSQLDPKRQGWWGWSWGGTFTLYAMSHSDRFRAGVSVAPVTDWSNYDSIYTERYMSEPGEFPEGYKDFSVVNSVKNLHGHLLLAQGSGDDNVHMQNIVQYVQQLILNKKPYDLQIFPRKTHSIAGTEVRPYLFDRILQQFEMYLKPVTNP